MDKISEIKVAEKKCLNGIALTRDEIISLLEIELHSGEDIFLRNTANNVARALTRNSAYIWSAIGADYQSCAMNCAFCSLGEKWGLIGKPQLFDESDFLEAVRDFVEQGARFIVLRTTEFYSLSRLEQLVTTIRANILGDYEIVLNVGEFDGIIAERLFDCGVNGIYHATRLREGQDTPFSVADRLATMSAVRSSPLRLISLVEPIGIEHSNGEIADNFLNILQYNAIISGAMARFPVIGTPLGHIEMLSEDRLSQIIAVLRLSGGKTVHDICVHPYSEQAINSGANVIVVERGAIPRDSDFTKHEWKDFLIENARKMLEKCGYTVYNRENKD